MGWVSPTSHSNNDGWSNPTNAYDGSVETGDYASLNYNEWCSCQFDRDYVWCNAVRLYCSKAGLGLNLYVYVDAYYDAAWHLVFGAQPTGTPAWYTGNLGTTAHVTAMRVRAVSTSGVQTFYLYEVEFYAVPSAPIAPTQLLCEGETNPTGVTDTTPELSAILNDPDPSDTLTHVAVQVATDDGFSNLVWDSGWLDIADIVQGNRCADVSYAGDAIEQAGQTFYFRIRAKDDEGTEGTWSSSATFTMAPKQVGISDAGSGSELISWLRKFLVSDAGAGAESASWKREVAVTDQGEASIEHIRVAFRLITIADAGAGAETMSPRQPGHNVGITIIFPPKDEPVPHSGKDDVIHYDPNAGA
jgi:hypothetical protein